MDSTTPKPYIARLYVTHDFDFGSKKESIESEENQLAGQGPETRYTITVGRFTLTDFFDNNRYTHDPRTQFMGWSVMYNGAWDYPADVRGYTWGWFHECHTANWSFRYGSGGMPRVANGLRFERRILEDRGDVFEQEHFGINTEQEITKDIGFFIRRDGTTARRRASHLPRLIGSHLVGSRSLAIGGIGRTIPSQQHSQSRDCWPCIPNT